MPRGIKRREFLTAAGSAAGVSVMGQHDSTQAAATTGNLPPTFDPAELSKTVHTVVKSKRIGKPVFVRLTVQGPDRDARLIRTLAIMIEMASSWIGQPLDRLYAIGNAASGQVCLTLQFHGGATALLSYAQGQTLGDGIDLLVLGNHGAIHHDPGLGTLWDSQPDFKDAKVDPKLGKVIEQALRTGQPTSL